MYLIYRSAARLTRFHRGLEHKEVGLRDLESIKIGLQPVVSPVTEVDIYNVMKRCMNNEEGCLVGLIDGRRSRFSTWAGM